MTIKLVFFKFSPGGGRDNTNTEHDETKIKNQKVVENLPTGRRNTDWWISMGDDIRYNRINSGQQEIELVQSEF